MPTSLKPLELGPFVPGVNNRRPETKMRGDKREDGGDFLRFAVNTDLTATGNIKRRQGYARVLTGTDCHSVWHDSGDTFIVDGSNLLRIGGLPGSATITVLRNDMAPGRPVSYSRAPDAIYYTNSLVIGRILPDGLREVNTPGLSTAPVASTIAGGSLAPGRYGFCFTLIDAGGRESESTLPVYVDVSSGARTVQLNGLPNPLPAGTDRLVVYMTGTNDSVFQRAFVLPAISTMTVAAMPPLYARCATLLLRTMPAGDIVREDRGRLLVAAGKTLYYSEPYMPGLYNPSRGFIQFPSAISVVEPATNGVWVCADRTYWLAGDIAQAVLAEKLPYGGIRGSSGRVPNAESVYWMTPRGICVGTSGGEVSNRQEQNVAVATAQYAAGFFRERDGNKQMGQTMFGEGSTSNAAATSYMDAEVIRKGEAL